MLGNEQHEVLDTARPDNKCMNIVLCFQRRWQLTGPHKCADYPPGKKLPAEFNMHSPYSSMPPLPWYLHLFCCPRFRPAPYPLDDPLLSHLTALCFGPSLALLTSQCTDERYSEISPVYHGGDFNTSSECAVPSTTGSLHPRWATGLLLRTRNFQDQLARAPLQAMGLPLQLYPSE